MHAKPEPIPTALVRPLSHRLIWSAGFLWNLGCFGLFLLAFNSTGNPQQAAALAAGFCVAVLSGYVGCRALAETVG